MKDSEKSYLFSCGTSGFVADGCWHTATVPRRQLRSEEQFKQKRRHEDTTSYYDSAQMVAWKEMEKAQFLHHLIQG